MPSFPLPRQALQGLYGVRAACAKCGMQREMGHQVARNVLHAVTATEVDACQRTCNLAVLVAE